MRTLTQIALVWMALAAGVCAAPLERPSNAAEPGDALVLERFKFSMDDGAIFLPVQIDGKTRRFLLDSGAMISCMEKNLLKELRPVSTAHNGTTNEPLPLFTTPAALVGKIDLRRSAPWIAGIDLTRVSEVTDCEIAGVLGYEFLRANIVQIDFDREECLILSKVAPDCGKKFDVILKEPRAPKVKLRIADVRDEEFLIDTGASGADSGALSSELCAELLKGGKCRVVGSTLADSLAGTRRSRELQVDQISLGDFVTAQPVFAEHDQNILSLDYLSRFCVTFDFAQKRIYLKEGKRFLQADLINRSGLHFRRKSGELTVHSADADSAASKAGLKPGDVIVRIADIVDGAGKQDAMRRALCKPDADVPIVIRRDGKEITISLHLAPATIEPPK